MLAFRNMLVHRGRRTELGQYLPKNIELYGADGGRLLRTDRVTHLPRDPLWSDIEVFLRSPQALVLTEDQSETLLGLLASTEYLVETVAKDLMDMWDWRRSNPEKLLQPSAQWPNLLTGQSIEFSGYKPGSVKISPSAAMTMHPAQARRFRSAALDDASRALWESFD